MNALFSSEEQSTCAYLPPMLSLPINSILSPLSTTTFPGVGQGQPLYLPSIFPLGASIIPPLGASNLPPLGASILPPLSASILSPLGTIDPPVPTDVGVGTKRTHPDTEFAGTRHAIEKKKKEKMVRSC